jgi:hypothetical protein
MRCTLKRPTTSRTFTRASQSPRSKKLLSRLERKERISKWWLRAQVIREEDDSSECDAKEMSLFMRKFKKYINKMKISKGD